MGRRPLAPAPEAVIGIVDILRIKAGIDAGQMDVGKGMPVFGQHPHRLAARAGVEIPHEDGGQLFPQVVPVHILQDGAHAQAPRRAADVVEMGVEHPDFLPKLLGIHLAHGADAGNMAK